MTTFVDHEYRGVDVTRTWNIFEELKQYLRQICYCRVPLLAQGLSTRCSGRETHKLEITACSLEVCLSKSLESRMIKTGFPHQGCYLVCVFDVLRFWPTYDQGAMMCRHRGRLGSQSVILR